MTDPLVRLTREVARTLGDGPGPARRQRQRAAVARLTRAAPAPRPGAVRWLVPLAAAVVLALLVARRPATPAALTATIAEQSVMVGDRLAAPAGEARVVEFSDRSRAELAAGAAARLTRLGPAQVELHLERGAVALRVRPAPCRDWLVRAGPFTVALLDGDSRATWDPEVRTLVVEVLRGAAEVTGQAQTSRLIAGERLELRAPPPLAAGGDLSQEPSSAEPPGDLSQGPSFADPDEDAARGAAPAPRSPPASPRRPAWMLLAEAGDHRGALAAAEQLGFSRLLATLDVAALDLLARSARFAGAGDRARDALLALRRRFPADARARTAAFLLGRVAFDIEADPTRAREWFSTYLAEAPGGALAGEARRRLDELDPAKDK